VRVSARLVSLAAAIVVAGAALILAVASSDSSSPAAPTAAWPVVERAAQGQTVKLWMWGGEDALNRYIDEEVAPRAAAVGVRLERVPVDDTATALARIASERDAGVKSGGAVDLLWVNGKNFEQGKAANLWLTNWADAVPNARYLDAADTTLQKDFGVAVDAQELPWSRAAFVFAYDPTKMTTPPRTFAELASYAKAHTGRVTYPAPPDFTGSAFVRQAVQALGEDKAMKFLADLEPSLWQGGRNHPKDEAELEQLFANGQVDLAMSYNPNFVDTAVQRGEFPTTVRPYVFESGTLQNVSFLAIPANAAHRQGAEIVANLMLSPELQALKAAEVGIPTVLDLARLTDAQRTQFNAVASSPYRLAAYGIPLGELAAARVPEIDRRWKQDVLR
jgi:putative spermidine/putrescine transport system substrate-binding protein